MTTKLTLTIEESVLKKAKSYAKHTGRSLSELVENYLDGLTKKDTIQEISPTLIKLSGTIKVPVDFDEKAELKAYFDDKPQIV